MLLRYAIVTAAIVSGVSAGNALAAAAAIPAIVHNAVDHRGRPPSDKDRDADLKPEDTIAFSGMKAGDKVADLVPGVGYYTRIFSKIVGPKGRVYAVVPLIGPAPVFARQQERKDADAMRKEGKTPSPNPVDAMLALQNLTDYANITTLWEPLDTFDGQFAVPEQLDVVWIADNYHLLHNKGIVAANAKSLAVGAVDKQIFLSLKPGGIFLVQDSAAEKGAGFSQTETLNRSEADAVKSEILSAGFLFDGESNALARSGDDRSKPLPQTTLVSNDLMEITASNYSDVDKSDHFVMRFKKPLTATGDKRPPKDAMNGYYGNTIEGQAGTKNERHSFYNEDQTYQEFGNSGTLVQEGTYFWDASGHNCMIYQFPIPERQGLVCHDTALYKKPGDKWFQSTAAGPNPFAMIAGHHPLPH